MLVQKPTSLMSAVLANNLAIVQMISNDWTGYQLEPDMNKTALMFAAENDFYQAFPYLQQEANLRDVLGRTALMYAAMRGSAKAVFFLSQFEILQQDNEGFTALHYAAKFGHEEAAVLLLKEMRFRSAHGDTPLHVASSHGWLLVCRHLLQCKTNVNLDGETALILAARNNHKHIVQLLILTPNSEAGHQNLRGETALFTAAIRNNVECVERLVELEAGFQTQNGVTALMAACLKGHTKCAEILYELEAGLCDKAGQVATDYAQHGEHRDTIRLLMRREAEELQQRERQGYLSFFNGEYEKWRQQIIGQLYPSALIKLRK